MENQKQEHINIHRHTLVFILVTNNTSCPKWMIHLITSNSGSDFLNALQMVLPLASPLLLVPLSCFAGSLLELLLYRKGHLSLASSHFSIFYDSPHSLHLPPSSCLEFHQIQRKGAASEIHLSISILSTCFLGTSISVRW